MSAIKEMMVEVIRNQPDDASYEEIMRELAFERMIERGLADSRSGKVTSNYYATFSKAFSRSSGTSIGKKRSLEYP